MVSFLDRLVRLAPGVIVHALKGDRDLVVGAREPTVLLEGDHERDIVRRLHPAPLRVRDLLQDVLEPPRVHYALGRLERWGIVVPVPPPSVIEARVGPGLPGEAIMHSLAVVGIGVESGAELIVSFVAGPRLADLLREADEAQASGRDFAFLWWWGAAVWMSARLGADGAPCARCVVDRLRHNNPGASYLGPGAVIEQGFDPAPAARAVAVSVPRWAAPSADLLRWDPSTGASTRHVLGGAWACSSCSFGGSDLASLVDPHVGLIARVEAARDAPPFVCFAASARCPPATEAVSQSSFHRVSSGKGATLAAATTGAVAEAVERISATRPEAGPTRRDTFECLCDRALHPEAVLGFSPRQYTQRPWWAARLSDPRRWIPPKFEPSTPIAWSQAMSLVDGRPRWIPSALVYLNRREAHTFCYDDPNGLAAGPSVEHAQLHALLELIERDAVALWWYSRAHRPAVDLPEGEARRWLHGLRSQLGDIVILDLTTDLGVPVYAAVAPDGLDPRLGFGCHVDPARAAARAIAELAQVSVAAVSGPRWTDADRASATYLGPHGQVSLPDSSFRERPLEYVVKRLVERGHDAFTHELPEVSKGLSTVRVIAPGLCHFWPRFGKRRLFEAPVGLGWIDAPLAEAELNLSPLLW